MDSWLERLKCSLLALLAVVAVAGCDPGKGDVVLATGSQNYVTAGFYGIPVSDKECVPIIHGGQGGYHVWGSIYFRSLNPVNLKLVFTVSLDGGPVVNTVTLNKVTGEPVDPTAVNLDANFPSPGDGGVRDCPLGPGAFVLPDDAGAGGNGPNAWQQSLGNYVFIPDPRLVDGKAVRIRVDVTDTGGRTGSAEERIVPYLVPGF